jgi:hypothetical protein
VKGSWKAVGCGSAKSISEEILWGSLYPAVRVDDDTADDDDIFDNRFGAFD